MTAGRAGHRRRGPARNGRPLRAAVATAGPGLCRRKGRHARARRSRRRCDDTNTAPAAIRCAAARPAALPYRRSMAHQVPDAERRDAGLGQFDAAVLHPFDFLPESLAITDDEAEIADMRQVDTPVVDLVHYALADGEPDPCRTQAGAHALGPLHQLVGAPGEPNASSPRKSSFIAGGRRFIALRVPLAGRQPCTIVPGRQAFGGLRSPAARRIVREIRCRV